MFIEIYVMVFFFKNVGILGSLKEHGEEIHLFYRVGLRDV